jgi:hypothetical protein
MFKKKDKVKVAVLGKSSGADGERYRWVEETLRKHPDVEVVAMTKQQERIIRQRESGWADIVFEATIETLDKVDAILVFHPVNAPVGLGMLGWAIGYGWSLGKPILYMAYDHPYIKLSIIPAKCIHAHITSEEALHNYDFKEMPVIAFKGEII